MLHQISDAKAGPTAGPMKQAIEACVHCGFCLPTCPTYRTMGDEMNSPRGRIYLMKEALEGKIEPSDAEVFIDNCLGCQACVTACPSGVEYGELLSPYRAWSEKQRERPALEKLQRMALLQTIPYPGRFRIASELARLAKPLARHLPAGFGAMLELAPDRLPPKQTYEETYPAIGERKGRVALLIGCAQQALAPQISTAAIRSLTRNGVEVVVPSTQGCCGSLAMHIGAQSEARKSALRNLAAFPSDIDAIISTAAGCGSGMKEYALLFEGEDSDKVKRAKDFSAKTMDVCEYLDLVGFAPPSNPSGKAIKVAYHDACHLAHAQKIRAAPRQLLRAIPNIELIEPTEWEICCGSAGTYNIEHPDTAKKLGRRKATLLLETGADVIATGNIGCLTQIRFHLDAMGANLPIVHTVELLEGVKLN